jgi:hypothetical protein
MWNPILQCIVVGLAVSQIFGSRAAPLNFSRYPDWCCCMMARLFEAVIEQCIDDLICIERLATAASARMAWLNLAANCGWHIPLEKSPVASQLFRALGVFVNLKTAPRRRSRDLRLQRPLDLYCVDLNECFRTGSHYP